MYNCWIGIDPGLAGAIAWMIDDKVSVRRLPLAGKELDVERLSRWMGKIVNGRKPIACVEKVGAMPHQGIVSTGNFMYSVGAIHALLAAHRIPRVKVPPTKWKALVLAGTARDKLAAIDFCRSMYPSVSILATPRSRKPDTNMADALCIARYCRLVYNDIR